MSTKEMVLITLAGFFAGTGFELSQTFTWWLQGLVGLCIG